MLLVNCVDSKGFLMELFQTMYAELPAPKKRGRATAGCLFCTALGVTMAVR